VNDLLDFIIEKRGTINVLVWNDGGWCRPATDTEVVLWDALIERSAKIRAVCERVLGMITQHSCVVDADQAARELMAGMEGE